MIIEKSEHLTDIIKWSRSLSDERQNHNLPTISKRTLSSSSAESYSLRPELEVHRLRLCKVTKKNDVIEELFN